MAGSAIITGLTIFFSLTTLAVVAYPLIKLTPSWLERRLNGKIAFHRDALATLDAALTASGNDAVQVARLTAQRDFHQGALRLLAVAPTAPTVTGPLPIDIAA